MDEFRYAMIRPGHECFPDLTEGDRTHINGEKYGKENERLSRKELVLIGVHSKSKRPEFHAKNVHYEACVTSGTVTKPCICPFIAGFLGHSRKIANHEKKLALISV